MLPAALALGPLLGGGLAGLAGNIDLFEDDAFAGWDLDVHQLQQYLNMLNFNRGYTWGYDNGQLDQLRQQQQQAFLAMMLGIGGRPRRRCFRRRRANFDTLGWMAIGGGFGGGGFGGGGFGGGVGLPLGALGGVGGFGAGAGMAALGMAGINGGGGVGALVAPQLGSHHLLVNQPRLWFPA